MSHINLSADSDEVRTTSVSALKYQLKKLQQLRLDVDKLRSVNLSSLTDLLKTLAAGSHATHSDGLDLK